MALSNQLSSYHSKLLLSSHSFILLLLHHRSFLLGSQEKRVNHNPMADDGVLRSSLVWLAVVVVVVGVYTEYSVKKMVATYVLGMLGLGGLLLPDWEFFDRPVSQWIYPLSVDDLGPHSSHTHNPPIRFRFYPVRTIVYGVVYGFAFYKWWMFISSK